MTIWEQYQELWYIVYELRLVHLWCAGFFLYLVTLAEKYYHHESH